MAVSKCLMIAGYPCGGTSAVAGMFHEIGVSMGKSAQVEGGMYYKDWIAYDWNPKGQYEDDSMVRAEIKLARGNWYKPLIDYGKIPNEIALEMVEVVKNRMTEPLWGMKSPGFWFSGMAWYSVLKRLKVDTRLIVVRRDDWVTVERILNRFQSEMYMSEAGVLNYVGDMNRNLSKLMSVMTRDSKVMVVDYDALTDPEFPPEGILRPLMREILDGWKEVTEEDVQTAAAHLDPNLNHLRTNDQTGDIRSGRSASGREGSPLSRIE